MKTYECPKVRELEQAKEKLRVALIQEVHRENPMDAYRRGVRDGKSQSPRVVHGVVKGHDPILGLPFTAIWGDMIIGTFSTKDQATQALIEQGRRCGVIEDEYPVDDFIKSILALKPPPGCIGGKLYCVEERPYTGIDLSDSKPPLPVAEEPFVEPTKYNAGYATNGEYSVGIDFAPDRITTIILQHKHGEPMQVIDSHQVMTPPAEPVHEWVYGVWDISEKGRHWRRFMGYNGDAFWLARDTVEDTLRDMMAGAGKVGGTEAKWRVGIPTFGVRLLTADELRKYDLPLHDEYGICAAFYNGKYIKDSDRFICSNGSGYISAIRGVLKLLTPAQPAVTLADLECVEPE